MKKLYSLLTLLIFLNACGNGSSEESATDAVGAQSSSSGVEVDIPVEVLSQDPLPVSELDSATNLAIADNFCANETNFKVLSTSLLSAYSDLGRGNYTDPNYCGGTSELTTTDTGFTVTLTNYCVLFRDQQVLLNGTIKGAVDSGVNIISEFLEPDISIIGEGFDLSVVGDTRNGRNDDMFMNLTITDNFSGNQIVLDETNIKKGEFDFGYFSFEDVGPYRFLFIKHFNADLTEGQLFIYGSGEEYLILTAENGIVTVVFKRDRHDPGVLVESSCSS